MALGKLRVQVSRVVAVFTKRRRDAELTEEIQAHLDSLAEDYVHRGMSLDEARGAARRDFGGLEQMKEQYRAQRGLPLLETLAQDGRYTFRTFRKHRWFTSVAVQIDLPVLLFTGRTTLLVAVLIGLGPVFGAAPVDPQSALRDAKGAHASSKLGRWLVPAQVALATVLVVCAGLFLRTFEALRDVDLGFRTSKLVTFTVSPALAGYDDARSRVYLKDVL
jgi:hypothetical protein